MTAVFGTAARTLAAFDRNDGTAMAGFIAFTGLLAIFPLLISIALMAGVVVGDQDTQAIIDQLFDFAPEHVARTLEPVLREVLTSRGGSLLTVSTLAALWIGSNAFESFRVGFDRAYGYGAAKKRGYVARRARALGFVVLGGVTFVILGISILFGPLLIRQAEAQVGIEIPRIVDVFRYGLAIFVFGAFLLAMHRLLPSRPLPARALLPGVVLTVALWLIGATGFSVYLSFAPSYALTYGTLAGVVITLLFFYLTGAVIILGAELNAVLGDRQEEAHGGTEEA